MKKLSLLLFTVFGLFLIGFIYLVPAQKIVAAKSQNSVASQSNGNQGKNPNTTVTKSVTQAVDITGTQEQEEENTGNGNNRGLINAEAHRSAVANFVQNLLSVADREGGIGQQVRVIAQQQNDSKEKAAEAIDKVENRSKIKTFLIGSDYKNLGALRSEMVKTRNNIDQLKRLVDKTTIEDDKTTLKNQITALEQEQTNINDFITQNESKFSLFGWVAKLLNK